MVLIRFWRIVVPGLIRALIDSLLKKTIPKLNSSQPLSFICTPFDIDFNMHMNNSIYLRIMDFGRWSYLFQTGLFRELVQLRWRPVAAKVDITFRKPIPFLARINLDTRLIRVEGNRMIVEQVFYRPRDRAIYSYAEVSIAVLDKGKTQDLSRWSSRVTEPFSRN